MLNTGIRGGEMRALTIDKLSFHENTITISNAIKATEKIGKSKNGKSRIVPITSQFSEYLQKSLSNKTNYIIGGSHYVSYSGFRSRYNHFFKRLNNHLKKNNKQPIDKKSPHSLRHTYGTLCQKNGMPIAMVSDLLGHSSVTVTEVYTHFKDTRILKEP